MAARQVTVVISRLLGIGRGLLGSSRSTALVRDLRNDCHTSGSPDFESFVRGAFDSDLYLNQNPDVAAAGVEPAAHWLDYGLSEGRPFPGDFIVHADSRSPASQRDGRLHFTWRDRHVVARARISPPRSVLAQIEQQSRHDPAVLAPGARCLENLPATYSTDFEFRSGLYFRDMLSAIPAHPRLVMLLPGLKIGGSEQYAADLLRALVRPEARAESLIVLTRQSAAEAEGWERWSILEPFRGASLLFWSDVTMPQVSEEPSLFGRFLNMLQAEHIVVINSRLGLETVARFGRGLTQVSRLTCAYFRMGANDVAYGDFFPRRTAPFSLTLTDNEPMAETMRRLHGNQPGPGIRILPPRLPTTDEATFESRVAARRTRTRRAATVTRWCWISRIEPTKGLDILRHIASLRPTDKFDVFGPLEGGPDTLQTELQNLRYCGESVDIATADFTDYDGFLFTSYAEGMPNVVLAMSQHAIPMILTRVGGLSHTFNRGVRFIDHRSDCWQTAREFSAALDEIVALEPAEVSRMTKQARACALERHSTDVFNGNVEEIFGSPWPTST